MLMLVAGVPVAVLMLAGCGGGGGSSTPAAAATPAPSATGGAQPGAAGRGPAASGEIAAVAGKTLQVQSSSAQTAVTWSASTTFTKSVPATLASGDCVTVVGTPASGADALTATSVRVLSSGGTCAPGQQGGTDGTPRAFPSGGGRRGGTPPSGAPGGGAGPSGAPGGGGADFATAFGKVTSVSGSTVVLSGTLRSGGGRFGGSPGATPTATPTATPSASSITVTLGSSASVLATAKGTGADAKVGTCATATGKADSGGTVAATAIALSPKGANGCTAGFGRLPGGGLGG
jgi:hypothetical protein